MAKTRFYTPDINKWKYIDDGELEGDIAQGTKQENSATLNYTKTGEPDQVLGASAISSHGRDITDREKDKLIRNNVKFIDWSLSFSKNCIQLSFIIFLIANIFIIAGITINYFQMGMLSFFDTYITEVYGMMRDVIGVYIIKTCLENSFKITMSVLSDYIDKKYSIKEENNNNIEFNDPGYYNFNSGSDEIAFERLAAAELVGANIASNSDDNSNEDFERLSEGTNNTDIEDDEDEEEDDDQGLEFLDINYYPIDEDKKGEQNG